jgi:serine/threonine protein kinase
MAPEQFRNAKNADARCDIYSLAATLYMMVTGELPFESNGPLDAWMKKVKNDITPPQELAPELSSRAACAIQRAMTPDPAQRPASCREFIEDLSGEQGPRVRTPPEENLDATLTNLWHLLYRDPDGVIHSTRETTEGVRRAMRDGSLGAATELRLSRRPQGPFEPARNFAEFRDLASAADTMPAGPNGVIDYGDDEEDVPLAPAPFATPEPAAVPTSPPILHTALPLSSPGGPHIDLGPGPVSSGWFAWLTLLALALAAGLVGYIVLPGLRFRWF